MVVQANAAQPVASHRAVGVNPALKILDETDGLGSMEKGSTEPGARSGGAGRWKSLGRMEEGYSGASEPDARSGGAGRWKAAGRKVAPNATLEAEMDDDMRAAAKMVRALGNKKTPKLKKATSRAKSLREETGKPSLWGDVVSVATKQKHDEFSEWNDLLAGVGFGDTMQRLSSYYQNNAILAGLLAAILFDTMAGARLFDLERGSLACPTSGSGPCMQTRAVYDPAQLEVSHYVFYISGYMGLIHLMCIIIVCVVADNGLKTVSTEEELKAFMSTFSFVQRYLAPSLYISVVFLGFHFAALILVHMYFSYNSMAIAAASIVVPIIIIFMWRKASQFAQQQQDIKNEKLRLTAAANMPVLKPKSQLYYKLKKASNLYKKGELPLEDATEV